MNWELRSTISAQSTDDWDGFGCSVDFNYGKILIGAKDAQVGINHQQGKAYLYSQSGTSWVREALFTPMTGESSLQFGATVHWGLSNMAIVGAPGYVNRYFYTEKGRVYWFINH